MWQGSGSKGVWKIGGGPVLTNLLQELYFFNVNQKTQHKKIVGSTTLAEVH